MSIEIGISASNREAVAKILNRLLSDEVLLYVKTRNYHWNVTGPDFNALHKFFEAQYEELDEIMDEVAERVRALGVRSFGSLAEFVKHATLSEEPGRALSAKAMIGSLLADHEAIVQALRKDLAVTGEKYGDMGTSDFLTGLMEQHEKMAWMLRAHLE